MIPAVFGIAGPALSERERDFFRASYPAGYILFGRNVVDRSQLRALTDSLRALHGRDDLPILIDQEGGRVQRMKPPEWPAFPPGAVFDRLWEVAPISAMEAARAHAEALALTLAEVGISVDCLPLLDVRQAGASDVIGDRALGAEPLRVASIGRAILDGLAAGGVVGVVKHIPGHGRAGVDSHKALPVVDADAAALATDVQPFERLNDAAMGMTAHVVYTAWDGERPATLSPTVIAEVIRGQIGFQGFLFSDDIDMKALSGTPAEKAAAAVAAGCDAALDCWARMDEMEAIAAALPTMAEASRARLDRAMAMRQAPDATRYHDLVAKRDALLAFA